jgi:uncharacterized membrane protein
MTPVSWIAFWAAAFVITHLATTGASVRPHVVGAVGEQPYLGIYSAISFATFVPLVIEYFRNKHAGPVLWWLRDVPAIRALAILLMLVSIVLLVFSFATPSPVSVGNKEVGEPRGALKITRHPLFVAIAIFSIAHLLMNGSAADVIFFGCLLLIAVVGCVHQDSRKKIELGEPYRRFCEVTSAFPFAAIASGRQKLTSSDLRPATIAVGIAVFVAIAFAHPYIFGGHPL